MKSCLFNKLKVILICIFFNLPQLVFAYPHFIGHGYNSCITCHYNPFGNGPINDYGRAVSGTAISSRNLYDDNKPEDLIAKETGFFFNENLQKHFRPFIGYRGLLMKSNLGEVSGQTDYINMQLDANLVIKMGARDNFIASGTFGYAPIPRSLKDTASGKSMKEYRSREHYIGYRPIPELGIYVGLLDKPFGLRIVEHNSFSRSTPLLNMNDQSHGLLLHYAGAKIEGGVNLFIGNLANEKEIQTKGISGTFEVTVFEKNRLGASVLKQKNDFLEMMATSIHSRSQLSHGTSLLFELGRVDKSPLAGTWSRKEYYSLIQNHININRGFYILNSIEYYKSNLDRNYRVRFGPGLQYMPMAKTEFRIDLYNTRNFNQETSTKDRWDLLGQLHLWF